MPSIRAVWFIGCFWLVTTAYVAYRDLWPVLISSGPPPVAIDLADEAAQSVPVRWSIHVTGQKRPGRLTTLMKYHEENDTFAFTHRFSDIRYETAGVEVVVPELTSVVRVTRGGDLREQSIDGKVEVFLNNLRLGEARARVAGTVEGGQLIGIVDAEYTLSGLSNGRIKRVLDPVAVSRGQPLNPLQPVNRLTGLRPGRRWLIYENDPLREVIVLLVKEQAGQFGFKIPPEKYGALVGEVLSEQRTLEWQDQQVPCWVIEYRRDELVARTWVRAPDGKVLQQEAFQKGETLTIIRDQ